MQVVDSMTKLVVTLSPEDTLPEVHEVMQNLRCRHLPITQNNQLVGLLSERDLLLFSTVKGDTLVVPEKKVEEVMSTRLITCRQGCTISKAAKMLLENKIDCLPVVDFQNHLLGIITTTDLLSLLLRDDLKFHQDPLPFQFNLRSLDEYRATA